MPYSKDPAKYPTELQLLPELLDRMKTDKLRIPTSGRSEAHSRRTQIQAYFSAVDRKAKEMRVLADRERGNRLKAAQLAQPTRTNAPVSMPKERALAIRDTEGDIFDAEAAAKTWEDRAKTCNGWMVRTVEDTEGRWFTEISKRSLGDFGTAMVQALKEATGIDESAIPPKPTLITEGIAAPVETTSVMDMLAKARRELQEKIDSGELPQKGA